MCAGSGWGEAFSGEGGVGLCILAAITRAGVGTGQGRRCGREAVCGPGNMVK